MTDLLKRMALDQAAEHLEQATAHVRAVTRTRDNEPQINLARLISDLGAGQVYGEDREALEEFAHRAGIGRIDPHRPFVPFSALTRDIQKGGSGGYLVGTNTPEAVDILRPWSVTARAGIQIETGLKGDQAAPRITGTTTAYWLADEVSEATDSDFTVGQIALTPHTASVVCAFSRQLARQTNINAGVEREMLRTLGTAVDQAVLSGTGASGQPTGIINTAGIGTQSGTSLDYEGVCAMKQSVAEANAPDESIAFIGTPAVRALLENRERAATGNGFIWDADRVASRPAYASTDIPTDSLICGAWDSVYVGIWGDGFIVEVNPHDPTGFKSGQIRARILLSLDVAVRHAAAINVASSIT